MPCACKIRNLFRGYTRFLSNFFLFAQIWNNWPHFFSTPPPAAHSSHRPWIKSSTCQLSPCRPKLSKAAHHQSLAISKKSTHSPSGKTLRRKCWTYQSRMSVWSSFSKPVLNRHLRPYRKMRRRRKCVIIIIILIMLTIKVHISLSKPFQPSWPKIMLYNMSNSN